MEKQRRFFCDRLKRKSHRIDPPGESRERERDERCYCMSTRNSSFSLTINDCHRRTQLHLRLFSSSPRQIRSVNLSLSLSLLICLIFFFFLNSIVPCRRLRPQKRNMRSSLRPRSSRRLLLSSPPRIKPDST